METAVKSWHETSKVDPRVYFLLDKERTQTDKYAPAANIDKVLPVLSINYSPPILLPFFLFVWLYAQSFT